MIDLKFVHRNCEVWIRFSGRVGTSAEPNETFVKHFGKVMARHLDEHFGVRK